MRKYLILTFLLVLTWSSYAQVNANFSSDTKEGCAPLTIKFYDQSTGANMRYRWSFGNGNLSTQQNPQAIFYVPGKYEISLEVTDSNGNKNEKKVAGYITVFKNPKADLYANSRAGCAPLSVQFEDKTILGDAPLTSTLWDFGDGNTTNATSPLHNYATNGSFDVSMLVTDTNGCQGKFSAPKHVIVDRKPDVNFIADITFSCTYPLTVSFSNLGKNLKSGDSYLWSFGDGETSTKKSPIHTYTSKGDFEVSLTITTANGCTQTLTKPQYITIRNITVDFEADKRYICAPTEVSFTNKTSPSGLNATWDFGDGTIVSGANVRHTYAERGAYSVKLSVEKDANCKASITKPNYIIVVDYPKATFTSYDTFSCKVPYPFLANNTSTGAKRGDWYLDGIYLDSATQIFKSFDFFGQHTLTLLAQNQYGCKDTFSKKILLQNINVDIEADILEGCIPLEVTFKDMSTHGQIVSSKKWSMGDKDRTNFSLHSDSVTFTYQDTGVFTMTLEVTTSDGCIGIKQITVRAGTKTNPDFVSNTDSVCNGDMLSLTNLTNVDHPNTERLTWKVYADDEYSSSGIVEKFEPFLGLNLEELQHYKQHTKRASRWYNVELITVHNGCQDTITKDSAFFVKNPLVLMSQPAFNSCTSDSLVLFDASVGADSIWWEIHSEKRGTEKFIAERRVVIYRNKHGSSRVSLTGTNFESKCVDTDISPYTFSLGFDVSTTVSGALCAPTDLQFNSTIKDSIDSKYTYQWGIGEDIFSDKEWVSHTIKNPGKYYYWLEATQIATGCSETTRDSFEVTGPTVSGSVTALGTCSPVAVKLTCDNNPEDFDSLYWLFDGRKIPITQAGEISDTLFVAGSGDYSNVVIELIGIDSNGCQGTEEFSVLAEGPKDGKIKLRRFRSCLSQRFLAEAIFPEIESADLSYYWDIGNGDTSTNRIASAVYDSVGQYNLQLTVTDKNGCKSRYNKVIDIQKERLQAAFDTDSIETDCPPVFVQFYNNSTATSRNITNYLWEFGDGSTSIEKNPSKLYLAAGRYTIKLFLIDEWDCEDSLIYPDFIIVNGPIGAYEFDKNKGCLPLTVNFTSTTERTNFYEWDIGDGTVVENTSSYTHVYDQPGRFIPLLILKDTFGCDYTLPPIDTIYVDPYPESDFEYTATCVNYPVSFKAKTQQTLVVSEYMWEMLNPESIDTFYGETATYTFKDQKRPQIRLTITSRNGCKNTALKTIELISLDAAFTNKNPNTCVGTTITLKNLTISDTTLVATRWIIDGETYTDKEPSFFASEVGSIQVVLIQENILGCKDTLSSYALVIGDSVRPKDPKMLRVTVNSDDEIQLDYMTSTNTDFREYIIYREGPFGFQRLASEANPAITSYYSMGNNTLNRSYCFKLEEKNTCGLLSDTFTDLRHCTIEIQAVGDTNKNSITWNKYEGWYAVSTYNIYRKELNTPSAMQWIGSVHGDSTSYTDSALYCNIDYSYRVQGIESMEENGNHQSSWSDTAHATPIWRYTPPSNRLVRATVEQDIEILIEWDSVTHSSIPITQYNLLKSINGREYSILYEGNNTEFSYIDKKVLVDNRSYFYQTYAIDECDDTTAIWNYGKTILLNADTSKDQRPYLEWSHYLGWTEAIGYYTVEIKNPDGSFMELASIPHKDTTFTDYLTDLNQRPNYCYRIVAYKEIVNNEPQVISISNEDCSPVRSTIYYPNAFTPNNDNLNDFYKTPSEYIQEYHIQIFNRWGEKVFESFDMTKNWDGTYKGKTVQQDAYAVIVDTLGVDLIRRSHHGTITVLR